MIGLTYPEENEDNGLFRYRIWLRFNEKIPISRRIIDRDLQVW